MPLVYDFGFHNGDDTAYYLSRGCRVVAVDANPDSVAAGRARFAAEIHDGRLTLLNVAVGPTPGRVTFWVSTHPEYSSFDRSNAEKAGQTSRPVEVEQVTLPELLSAYGIPHYLKLDVEGADEVCLDQLTPETAPPYLSFELGGFRTTGNADFDRVSRLGYSRFKLICQLGHRQVTATSSRLYWRWYRFCQRMWTPYPRLSRLLGFAGPRSPFGSSGPFGEDTHGPWRTAAEVAAAWRAFLDRRSPVGVPSDWHGCRSGPWFDVHCAR